MSELVVRPSRRQAHALLVLCLIPIGALLRYLFFTAPDAPKAWLLAGLIPFLIPLRQYYRSWTTRLTVEDGILRFQQGLITQNTASIALERIEKISVHRTIWQRLWGIGDIDIESAAESGAVKMAGIDDPQAVADRILALARQTKRAS